MRQIISFFTCLVVLAVAAPGQAASSPKGSVARNPYIGAIAIDAATGRVLAEDKADAKGYPASMLKIMDLLIVLEKIERKELSLQDQVPVSRRAAQTGGSQVWLAEKESFTVEDMLYALMIQSANDVGVALAEKVGGSYEGFVALMNAKAKQLGMTSTVFHSPHGLPPGPGQKFDVTTSRDFALLCRELVMKYPQALQYTSARVRTFRPEAAKGTVIMRTHNHLLGSLEGCDGLKTGFVSAAGFSIAVTAKRDNRRVIAIVLGSADRKVRDAKASEMVEKAFAVLGTSAVTGAASPTRASAAPAR